MVFDFQSINRPYELSLKVKPVDWFIKGVAQKDLTARFLDCNFVIPYPILKLSTDHIKRLVPTILPNIITFF